MSFFTQLRARQEAFDQKASVFMRRAVTPTVALVASVVVCLFSAWSFVVVFAGWPRAWAREFVLFGVFVAPALAFVSARDLWRSGWDVRLLLAALLSVVGFAFWCAATYFVIHPHAA